MEEGAEKGVRVAPWVVAEEKKVGDAGDDLGPLVSLEAAGWVKERKGNVVPLLLSGDLDLRKERNVRCFDGSSFPLHVVVERAKFLVASWILILPHFRGFTMDLLFKWREVALEEGE